MISAESIVVVKPKDGHKIFPRQMKIYQVSTILPTISSRQQYQGIVGSIQTE
jgi:hypothetical protein